MAQVYHDQSQSWVVIKRNGDETVFDSNKIIHALAKAGIATGEFDHEVAQKLAIRAIAIIQQLPAKLAVGVETIQDIV